MEMEDVDVEAADDVEIIEPADVPRARLEMATCQDLVRITLAWLSGKAAERIRKDLQRITRRLRKAIKRGSSLPAEPFFFLKS